MTIRTLRQFRRSPGETWSAPMSKPTAHAQHVRSAYDKRQRSAGIGGELRSTASSSRSGCKNYMAWSKRQQADAKRVVRGRVELPTFRFSGQSVETLY